MSDGEQQTEPIRSEHQRKILELILSSNSVYALRSDLYNPRGAGVLTIQSSFGTFDKDIWYPCGDVDFHLFTPNIGGMDGTTVQIEPSRKKVTQSKTGLLYAMEGLLYQDSFGEASFKSPMPKVVHAMAHNYDEQTLGKRIVEEIIPQLVEAGYEIRRCLVWSCWAGRPPAVEMDGEVLVRNPKLSCRSEIADYCRTHKIPYKEKLVKGF